MNTRGARPLRVVAFTDHFSPQSSGGVEHVVWEVYRRLAAQGVEVLIVTAMDSKWTSFSGVEGMRTHASRMWDMSPLAGAQVGFAPDLFRSTSREIEAFQADVLHANGIHFQSTLAAALANHDRRRPMVLTSHVGKLDDLPQPTRALTTAYESSIGRYIFGRCTRFIAISPSVREHLVDLGITADRIDDVANGVDHSRFFPAGPGDAGHTGPPLLMFVGRHMPNKGPQVFLEALAILRDQGVDFRAEFLSSGPLRERLESRTDQLRLRPLVTFRGHVPDVAVEMRRADVIARPSFTEGMPLSLLEAMATGVCLVVSDVSGNYDLVRDGVNGLLFPAGRADLLAGAMKRVITSPELRRSLGEAARTDSLAHSWDRCAAETLEVLERTIAQSQEARAARAGVHRGTAR